MGLPNTFLLLAGGGFLLALCISLVATRFVLGQLQRRNVLDIPNERSSHVVPTPRGGGWGIVIGTIGASAIVLPFTTGTTDTIWAAGLGLAVLIAVALSWRDDLGGLPVRIRLAVQYAAAGIALAALYWTGSPYLDAIPVSGPMSGPMSGALAIPIFALILAIVLTGYVWFINLYNFMDGIDGISAIETGSVLIAMALIATHAGVALPVLVIYPLICAGAALGFLAWNWHPAKVFLGDVGSVPLGIIVGFFLLAFASHGFLVSAMILPLYYIADATITLLRRLIRGEKVWQAHRSHWYQRAAQVIGHRKTVLVVLAGNAGLALLALFALSQPLAAFTLALVWTALLLGLLSHLAKTVDDAIGA